MDGISVELEGLAYIKELNILDSESESIAFSSMNDSGGSIFVVTRSLLISSNHNISRQ